MQSPFVYVYMYVYRYVCMLSVYLLRFLRNILWQSSIDHCCRYLAGDSAKIMASTLLNVAHDDEAGSSIFIVVGCFSSGLFFVFAFCCLSANHGDCIALRLSRKLNCLAVGVFLFSFTVFPFGRQRGA